MVEVNQQIQHMQAAEFDTQSWKKAWKVAAPLPDKIKVWIGL